MKKPTGDGTRNNNRVTLPNNAGLLYANNGIEEEIGKVLVHLANAFTSLVLQNVIPDLIKSVNGINKDVTSNQNDALLNAKDKFHSIEEAAAILKVSRQTIHNWIRTGKLLFHRIKGSRRRYIKQSDIDKAFLSSTKF